jgi:hypothetical protein
MYRRMLTRESKLTFSFSRFRDELGRPLANGILRHAATDLAYLSRRKAPFALRLSKQLAGNGLNPRPMNCTANEFSRPHDEPLDVSVGFLGTTANMIDH